MMQHNELLRQSVLLETYIEKLSRRSKQFARKWFKLEGNLLSYSLRERLDVRSSVFIDKKFNIIKKDPNSLTFAFDFIDKKGKKKIWELKFSSMVEFMEWTTKICIGKRPIWDPQNSDKCVECNRNFNFFRRQHHCRNCGRVVCGDHSESRFLLEDLAYTEPVRVCDTCTKQLS